MVCGVTSQNLREPSTRDSFIGNSTAESMEINEKMDIYSYDLLMHQPNIIRRQQPLTRLLEVDSSATSSNSLCFEIRSETSLTVEVVKEGIHEEMIEHNIIVQMPPNGRYTLRVKGFRRKKAEPRIVLPEWL